MRQATRLAALAIVATSAAAPAARAADPAVTGMWLDQSGRGGIDIEPCGERLCGTMAWLKVPLNDKGKPKTDIHNSEPTLQERPLCGLKVLWDFEPDGTGAWAGGKIYDPEHGDTYSSNMHLQADGSLRVRGFIGFSLLGKSQTWTRPAGTLARCT